MIKKKTSNTVLYIMRGLRYRTDASSLGKDQPEQGPPVSL